MARNNPNPKRPINQAGSSELVDFSADAWSWKGKAPIYPISPEGFSFDIENENGLDPAPRRTRMVHSRNTVAWRLYPGCRPRPPHYGRPPTSRRPPTGAPEERGTRIPRPSPIAS